MSLVLLLSVLTLSQAEVDYTLVDNLQELRSAIKQDISIIEYKEICEAELKNKVVPVHCYQWLRLVNMLSQQKKFLKNWLDKQCQQNLDNDGEKNTYAYYFLNKLTGECKMRVQASSKAWIYKKSVEGGVENINSPNIGRKFENILKNEVQITEDPVKLSHQ